MTAPFVHPMGAHIHFGSNAFLAASFALPLNSTRRIPVAASTNDAVLISSFLQREIGPMLGRRGLVLYDLDHTHINSWLCMHWQALIDSQPALATIPPKLRAVAERKEITPGETLFRLGDRLQGVFFVVAGEIRLVRRARNGAEIVLQRSRGGFFAEASLGAKAYHCDAVAAESSAVLRFPAPDFRAALREDETFRDAWISHLASEVRKSRAQCERLSLKTAAQRIVHYIESEGADSSVILTESRKAWAAELALTHEALYRTLRQLQADGTLSVDGNRLTLRQRRGTG
jgi:CRP-like cAMP-binding protein